MSFSNGIPVFTWNTCLPINRASTCRSGASVRWDGPTLATHLKRQFGIQLKVRQAQQWMHQLGYRLKRAGRPGRAFGGNAANPSWFTP